jgi:hypothetical protein
MQGKGLKYKKFMSIVVSRTLILNQPTNGRRGLLKYRKPMSIVISRTLVLKRGLWKPP